MSSSDHPQVMDGVAPQGTPRPRAAVFSLRNMLPSPARAGTYELEDVIAEVDDAVICAPSRPSAVPPLMQRAVSRVRRAVPPLGRRLPVPARCPLEEDVDVLLAVCQSAADLLLMGPLDPWRRRCRLTVAYIDEVWAWQVPHRKGEMELLSQFDYVFTGCEGSVEAVAEATRRPTFYLPAAVDALRFSPLPRPPERVIDVYNMGRRSLATHRALQRLTQERGWFYLHSSIEGKRVTDILDHRLRLASLIQRTRYFLANRAKITRPDHTHGQEELGYRFFEGAAGGAVLLGEPPRRRSFEENFGWEDAVIPLRFGTSDVASVIDALEADPERVARIRQSNMVNVLLRHDWCHRWGRILHTIGLLPREALVLRQSRLEERVRKIRGDAAIFLPKRRTNGAHTVGGALSSSG